MNIRGAYTALVTPFKNGQVDEQAYRDLIEWQIEQGIDGLVPCGTTGEAATLTHEEQGRVIRICVEQAKGRVPVIAGAGSNNTIEAINLSLLAKDAGADAVLLITPYYNKPTRKGLIAHFKAVAEKCDLPIIAYNVPGRTGLNMKPEVLAEVVREVPSIIGVKEATADLVQITNIMEECGRDFLLLSGDDFTVLPTMSIGGGGTISVVSNIVPDKMAALCKAYDDKDHDKAYSIHLELAPLCRAMFAETNPIPVKTALSMMRRVEKEFRLPLTTMEDENEVKLKAALKKAGLI